MSDPGNGREADEAIRVEHISKRFGAVRALEDVSMHLGRGEVLGLIGDNGAGKSTLVKIISGFQKPDSGTIFVDGEEVSLRSVAYARSLGIDTVYQDLALVPGMSVYHNMFLKRELLGHLRQAGVMRRGRKARTVSSHSIVDGVSIRERPAEVADRAVPGHWEGDLLMGDRHSQIATLVERSSRYVMLIKIDQKEAKTVNTALARAIRRLPAELRRSLTWDRGSEMSAHKDFTVATDVAVYFADPKSPWQRGSNENTNGLLRQYFPKGTNLSGTQTQLDAVALKLNTRPRKTLEYLTPADKLAVTVALTG